MVDMTAFANPDGKTTEEKLQDEIAGEDVLLVFRWKHAPDTVLFQQKFKQGVTFEWVKNKVAEHIQANYHDLSLLMGTKRIPEPFCLVDMGITKETVLDVQIEEGALYGEALRAQVLAEMEEEERLAQE